MLNVRKVSLIPKLPHILSLGASLGGRIIPAQNILMLTFGCGFRQGRPSHGPSSPCAPSREFLRRGRFRRRLLRPSRRRSAHGAPCVPFGFPRSRERARRQSSARGPPRRRLLPALGQTSRQGA